MAAGYGIALTINGSLSSMLYFFIAAVLVIIGSYLLFVSLSIAVLKFLKKNKKYYYKDKHFLSISGILHRMKTNGIGLASIAVLCTGIIITLSVTLSINSSMSDIVSKTMKKDYQAAILGTFGPSTEYSKIKDAKNQVANFIEETGTKKDKVESVTVGESLSVFERKQGSALLATDNQSLKSIDVGITTLDSYNKENGTSYKLEKNHILVASNRTALLQINSLTFAGKKYSITKVKNTIPANVGIEAYAIVVPDYKTLTEAARYYVNVNSATGKKILPYITISGTWNVKNPSSEYAKKLKVKANNRGLVIESKEEFRKQTYELNGGFLFLGVLIGCIFLIGTLLITYYKQVSEGFEDRQKYQIMKKVGLPDKLIKQTASNQIVWMFFIPLIVALVHSLVASKIVYQLLGLFGVHSYLKYISEMAIIIGSFAIIYLIIFKLTSNVYYKIVR